MAQNENAFLDQARSHAEAINDWYNDYNGEDLAHDAYDEYAYSGPKGGRQEFMDWVVENATAGMDPKLNETFATALVSQAVERLWPESMDEADYAYPKVPQSITDAVYDKVLDDTDLIEPSWCYKPTGQWIDSEQLVAIWNESQG